MNKLTNDQIRQNVRARYQTIAVKRSKLPLPAADLLTAVAVTPHLILMPYPLSWVIPARICLQLLKAQI